MKPSKLLNWQLFLCTLFSAVSLQGCVIIVLHVNGPWHRTGWGLMNYTTDAKNLYTHNPKLDQLAWCYLCSALRACFHGGCRQHTDHTGSHQGYGLGHKVVSRATSVKGGSSCSGSSSPCEVPCPCQATGSAQCSAFLPAYLPPEDPNTGFKDHLNFTY